MDLHRVFRVLVAMPLGAASGHKIITGIYRFLGEGYSWDIELVRKETAFSQLFNGNGFNANDFDGMIVAFAETQELRRKQAAIDLPTVFVDHPDAIRATIRRHAFVREDEKSIARAAAQHLLGSGPRASFAFVPTRARMEWSCRRQTAFIEQMKAAHKNVFVFDGEGNNRNALAEWLVSLPKPAGILAAFDDRAIDVLEACRRSGLSVPEDVAVLGIGNDELICDAAVPPLSSVVIDFANQGYRAARELHALMLGGHNPRTDIRFGATRTVVRSSTAGRRPSAALASRAMAFVKDNALHGITTRDVVEHLHASRRLTTLRFREAYGQSILESILDIRLTEAKRLLTHTNLTVMDIALRSGFNDPAAFRAVFTRRFGISPRAFRAIS